MSKKSSHFERKYYFKVSFIFAMTMVMLSFHPESNAAWINAFVLSSMVVGIFNMDRIVFFGTIL